jgi:hypothetical protein
MLGYYPPIRKFCKFHVQALYAEVFQISFSFTCLFSQCMVVIYIFKPLIQHNLTGPKHSLGFFI